MEKLILQETDSTMTEAARRAPTVTGPLWILALRQKAARGRRGREWVNPDGNFAATLVMPTPNPMDAALRSFIASLALYDTFQSLGIRNGLALKWPNDVLLNGGKVAGILLESLPSGHLSIGIGINLKSAPKAAQVEEGAVAPVTLGTDATPEEVLDILAPAFTAWDMQLSTYGFEPIRTAWTARAAKLGEPIRARTMRDEHHGTFEGIDADGQLILSTPKGRLTIAAADVFF